MIHTSTRKAIVVWSLLVCLLGSITAHARDMEGVRAVYFRKSFAQWGFTPDKVRLDGLTQVLYFDASVNPNTGQFTYSPNDSVLTDLRDRCHQQGVECMGVVFASPGTNFTGVVADPAKRATAISGIVNWVREARLDGVDIDFEHPATVTDTNNLGLFITELRQALGPRPKLMAAVAPVVANTSSIPPSVVNEHLDMLNIMSYDHGGEHATWAGSLGDLSFHSSKGVLPVRMVLGVPFYGVHTSTRAAKGYSGLLYDYDSNPAPSVNNLGGYYFNGVDLIRNKGKLAYEKAGGVFAWVIDQDMTDHRSLLTAMHEGAQAGQATLDGFEYPLFCDPNAGYTLQNISLAPILRRTSGTYGVRATLNFSGAAWAGAWLHGPTMPTFPFPSDAEIRLNAYIEGDHAGNFYLYLTDSQGRRAARRSHELESGSGWKTITMPQDENWDFVDGAFDFNSITQWSLFFYGGNRGNTVPPYTRTFTLDNLVMYSPGATRPQRADTDSDNDGVPDSNTASRSVVWIDRFQHAPATQPDDIYEFNGSASGNFSWADASFGFNRKVLDCNLDYTGTPYQIVWINSPSQPAFVTTAETTLHFELDVLDRMPNATLVIDVFDADGNNRRYWNYNTLKSKGLKIFDLKMSDFTDGSNDLSRIIRWRIGIEGTGTATSPFTGRIQLADLAWGRLPVGSTVKTFIGDQDNDGLSDVAEDKNLNGIVDSGETAANIADTDGDTYTDGVENRLGTNALDPSSQFISTHTRNPDGTLSLTWPSAPGTTFTIRSSTDLSDWSTIVTSGLPASASTTTSYNLGTPRGTGTFYKVVLE